MNFIQRPGRLKARTKTKFVGTRHSAVLKVEEEVAVIIVDRAGGEPAANERSPAI